MSNSPELIVRPQTTPLRGSIIVPGDKSISHRAVMFAALAEGTSIIRQWLPAGDTLSTLGAIQALGVRVEIDRHSPTAWDLQIEGRGLHGLRPPAGPLDCRNAGTAIRLLAGIMAGQAFPSVLDGSAQLRRRPMRRVTEPLREMGADIESSDGRAPLSVRPAALRGVDSKLAVASAQVKSAVLLAGLYAEGRTRVYQPGPARDHTERMLAAMGIDVGPDGDWVTLAAAPPGGRRLRAIDLTVPGDISSAAFPLVAAAVVPGSEITIRNVGVNDTRTGLLDILAAMGAHVEWHNQRISGGEPAADLTVRHAPLRPTDVSGTTVVRAIDEFPIWSVAALWADGRSTVRDASELRVKEVDRIGVLAGELRRLGAQIDEFPDGMDVQGTGVRGTDVQDKPGGLVGATVDSHDDHRLAMSLAVAGLTAAGETTVLDAGCAADSFPGFVEIMQQLGANLAWAGR